MTTATRAVGRRSALRRARVRRAFATVFLPGLLAMLMVWTAGPAQASVGVLPVVPIAGAAGEVAGGAEVVAASRLVCASGTACLIMSVPVLGMVAGATASTWAPWVANKWRSAMQRDGGPWESSVVINNEPPLGTTTPGMLVLTIDAATIGGAGQSVSFEAASECEQVPGGLRYQVNKTEKHESPQNTYTSDPYYQLNAGFLQRSTTQAWRTNIDSTPTTALDGTTPNPARGRNGGAAELTDDYTSMCNAGDKIISTHAVGTEFTTGVTDNAYRTYDFGPDVASTAPYDATVHCRRPDGSSYDRTESSVPTDAPAPITGEGILIPACDPGDTMTGGTIRQGDRTGVDWTNDTGWGDGTTSAALQASWSASRSTWPVAGLSDGVAGDSASDTWAACSPASAVLTADFGSLKNIDSLAFTSRPDYSMAPINYSLSVSRDGVSWESVKTLAGPNWNNAPGSPKVWTEPVGRVGRYLKVDIPGAWNSSCVAISEALAKGSQAAPDPSKSQYPACVGVSPACAWTIELNGVQCTPAMPACLQWSREARDAPSHVNCRYGPYVVDIAKCYALERSFEGLTIPATRRNTDGDPDTWDPPKPSWAPDPQPTPTQTATPQPTGTPTPTYTDNGTQTAAPQPTGTQTTVPAPGVDPNPDPNPTSTNSTQPNPTGSSEPSSSPTPSTAPVPYPGTTPGQSGDPGPNGEGAECYPNGWGVFNPVEWVLRPVGCALDKAFKPRVDVLRSYADDLSTRFKASTPSRWFDAVASIPTGLHADAGSCLGPPLDFRNPFGGGTVVWHPFAACTEPMATIRTIVYAALSAGCVVGGAFACKRILGASIGLGV